MLANGKSGVIVFSEKAFLQIQGPAQQERKRRNIEIKVLAGKSLFLERRIVWENEKVL